MDERQQLAIKQFVSDRTPRPLSAPLLRFDLGQEVAALHAESEYKKGHNARTLIKNDELRLVLVALKGGGRVQEHRSEQPVALQPLRGHVRVQVRGEVVEVHHNELLAIDQNLSFSIEAVEASEFLLWVGWSKD